MIYCTTRSRAWYIPTQYIVQDMVQYMVQHMVEETQKGHRKVGIEITHHVDILLGYDDGMTWPEGRGRW